MKIVSKEISEKWQEFTLINDQDMSVSVLNYGGIITQIMTPDRNGKLENVVLGYLDYKNYEADPNYFGALVGRVAGRIQNASFTLNDRTYSLESNEGKNHIHGGSHGFHQIIWEVESIQTHKTVGLKLTHNSADGEGGYLGNLNVTVTYTLNNNNELILDYLASTDQTTPLALTNHSYFNLSGDLKNTVQHHHVTMNSKYFAELDQALIPTGKKVNVTGSTFDFRGGRMLGDGFEKDSEQHKIAGHGYDHYFIFEDGNVIARDYDSGRILTIKTDQPGMVMYTANSLDNRLELSEGSSKKHLGVCFETQSSPAALHHEGFPNVLLEAGTEYKKRTVFSFGLE